MNEILELLNDMVEDPVALASRIHAVQELIWANIRVHKGEADWEALADLAYDLSFYQPDPKIRSSDAALLDEASVLREIREVLTRLSRRTEGSSST